MPWQRGMYVSVLHTALTLESISLLQLFGLSSPSLPFSSLAELHLFGPVTYLNSNKHIYFTHSLTLLDVKAQVKVDTVKA